MWADGMVAPNNEIDDGTNALEKDHDNKPEDPVHPAALRITV